eukprot:553150_1
MSAVGDSPNGFNLDGILSLMDPESAAGDALEQNIWEMFQRTGCLDDFKISDRHFRAFISDIRHAYPNNPYHNWTHAYNVLWFTADKLSKSSVKFSNLEILAALI